MVRGIVLAALVLIGATAFYLGSRETVANLTSDAPAAVVASATGELTGPPPADGVIQVFKAATCGCCGEWIKHLEEYGFTVDVRDMPNMMAVKAELGMPGELGSCHTARIAGYLIEGHVPARDIQQMLLERPDIAGLAVPGMPIGSPGMEIEGRAADNYDVLAFDAQGQTRVYNSY